MKQLLLFALMAFTLSLGVSCKKENDVVKQEVKVEKPVTKSAIDPIFDYNENVYPHNTGLCYCGKGPKCHPSTPVVHKSWCKYGQTNPSTPEIAEPCTCNLR